MYRRHSNTYSSKPRHITAKFAGKCASCGGAIAAGEYVEYFPAERAVRHPEHHGDRVKCAVEQARKAGHTTGSLTAYAKPDPGFVDMDRVYEDQCSDICGR